MSRIGKQPVSIPAGVTVSIAGSAVTAKGPKGELKLDLRPEVKVEVEGSTATVSSLRGGSDKTARAFHGMTRALINNMVIGVSEGYEKKLEINGVGYNAKLDGSKVVLNLGFSHNVSVDIPADVTVLVPTQTAITISGCDKQAVGELAAKIRKLRPPEPYKGKGIKYDTEVIKRKSGKAFGSA